jgi:hypothetical protein
MLKMHKKEKKSVKKLRNGIFFNEKIYRKKNILEG